MTKLLLVNPYDVNDKEYGPPRMGIGLAYLVSAVEKAGAAETRVLDKFAEYRLNDFDAEKTEKMLEKELLEYRPDFVGFTSYTETIADVIKDARTVKKILPDCVTMIGGAHATACAVETLEHYDHIDLAVVGEGEDTLVELLEGRPYAEIDGLIHRDGSEVIKNKFRKPRPAVDEIPFPNRRIMHMEYYTKPASSVHSRGTERYVTMLSSRGCRGACSFCLQVRVHRRFSAHSAEYVMREIDEILKISPDITAIEFIDNLFLCDVETTESLCRAFIDSGLNKRIKWKAQTRATNVNPEILALMKEAGCFMLGYGFESGSQKILDRMNKMTTVEDIKNAARYTKEAGIFLEGYFIYGYPGETEEDLNATLDVIQEIQPDFVGFGRFMPVPGCLDYTRLIKEDRIKYRYDDKSIDWESFNIYKENAKLNYSAIPDEKFAQLERKALYDVIKPINIRYHMESMGLKKMLQPAFILKLLKKSLIVFSDPKYFINRVKDFIKIVTKK